MITIAFISTIFRTKFQFHMIVHFG
uniref:Uncharacterized protein n=1 Tax=Anguilla anguilla TaxID=7936 RepID=A0A0E9S5Q0_ANGAN